MREAALAALASGLAAALPTAAVLRNPTEILEVGQGGLLVLRDGTLGAPDMTIGVRHYSWEAEPVLELYAAGVDEPARRTALDGMIAAAIGALEADRQLGGLVDWVEGYLTETSHEHSDAAPAVARGMVAITLHYQSTTAQG